MRRLRAALRKVAKPLVAGIAAVLLALLAPVACVELTCRGESGSQNYVPVIADPAFHRREANSYLTYPEWHIVYAYDGLGARLRNGDEHAFDYLPSISRFWTSTCALMRVADAHGGADGATRQMIYTIGVSFTLEMAVKAAYEETIGRFAAWLRGPAKTPQDKVVADMAVDYAAFLRQTPWYKYGFDREARRLWAAPITGRLRGWERRLGIGLELEAKAVYARVIAQAVAAAGEAAPLIRSIVADLDARSLSGISGVRVVRTKGGEVEIETPRYDRFTQILAEIAQRGGRVREIAGNDDIMVTMTVQPGSKVPPHGGRLILRVPRDGIPGERLLVDLAVADLAAFLRVHPPGDPGLEHVFDY
jgi:hypothetical protein